MILISLHVSGSCVNYQQGRSVSGSLTRALLWYRSNLAMAINKIRRSTGLRRKGVFERGIL